MILDLVTLSFKIHEDNNEYALKNYLEVIDWYRMPFYKRWFIKKPIYDYIKLTPKQ